MNEAGKARRYSLILRLKLLVSPSLSGSCSVWAGDADQQQRSNTTWVSGVKFEEWIVNKLHSTLPFICESAADSSVIYCKQTPAHSGLTAATINKKQLRYICYRLMHWYFSYQLNCLFIFSLFVFFSAKPVPCRCIFSQKVSLHLQRLRSVFDGSGWQSDRQRSQGRRHARDTLHLQVSM